MKDNLCRYYILNQMLLGDRLIDMPEGVFGGFDGADIEELQGVLDSIPVSECSPYAMLFLPYLRMPDYDVVMHNDSVRRITVHRVAEMVRAENIPVEEVVGWALGTITAISNTIMSIPQINDGVLYLPERDEQANIDLGAAMTEAFELFCWGVQNPSDAVKAIVIDLLDIFHPSQDFTLDKGCVAEYVRRFRAAGVHPSNLGRTVLDLSDLKETFKLLGLVAWYPVATADRVAMVVPRGVGKRLVQVVLDKSNFMDLCQYDLDGLKTVYVKGSELKFRTGEQPA